MVTLSGLQASPHIAARVLASSVGASDTPLAGHAVSHDAWDLLLGAPVLTEAGLEPAGEEHRDADGFLPAS